MPIMDAPEPADPHVVGNVGAVLTTQLIAFLLRKGKLTSQDVGEIFQDTRTRYTNTLGVPPSPEGWEEYSNATLTALHKDALRWGSQT